MLPSSERHDEQHGLDAWREQVEMARNPREENSWLSVEPNRPYAAFVEYMFFHYGENAEEAEKATAEG